MFPLRGIPDRGEKHRPQVGSYEERGALIEPTLPL
jgi:hypothetical protein